MNIPSPPGLLQVVLITGMSGSGKSVALHALEDAGFYCVDNLPPELLESFIAIQSQHRAERVAIAVDVRSASALPKVPQQLQALRSSGHGLTVLFLDTTTDTLVRRFSETRRLHPLSSPDAQGQPHALVDAIHHERELLSELREHSLVMDTTGFKAAHLRSEVKKLLGHSQQPTLTLVFQSFGFKRGVPMDADFVFDVRMLPNPHYEPNLRALTGLDGPVAAFLQQEPTVQQMQEHITGFLEQWLPQMVQDHRSYVTVAIGCTGGQHRSTYLVEQLAQHFAPAWNVHRRHRELEALKHAH